MRWLEKVPYVVLVPVALVVGALPFDGEPHLLEKTRMLREGTLVRPLDILDFLFHAAPGALLLLKMMREGLRAGAPGKDR